MREKLRRFMIGRYGVDSFSRFLMIVGLLAVMFSSFYARKKIGVLFYFVGWAILIYCFIRTFSRNITKRAAENQKFLTKTAKIKSFFSQRKAYHIYTCPQCRQKIRIPRGRGKVEIRCPKCGATFIKYS